MLPLRDDNPTRRFPVVTILLLLANVAVFFLVQPEANEAAGVESLEFSLERAAIPCEVVQGRPLTVGEVQQTFIAGDDTACQGDASVGRELFPEKGVLLAVLTSMFLHGGLVHLGGNLLFLWIFGNNIEDRFGPVRYLLFYLAAGVAATAAHILVQPDSTVPLVGASGAIAGVMGAYLIWFPRVRILTLAFFIITAIQARWVLGFWFVSQFFVNPNGGVAWMAHVGGFVFGVAIALVIKGSGGAQRAALRRPYASPSTDPWAPAPYR